MRKSFIMLSVPVDDLTMERALNRIEEFIAVGRATGRSHQVATINADFVVNALHDPELRYILQEADMTTADGMPLVWGARLLGVTLPERVTGADMVPALAERAAQRGYSLYLLGAKPGVAARAAQALQERYPGLKIAGIESPPHCSILEMDRAILDRVKAARPDILLVAFGNPKQEKWISMYARELGIPLSIGVGGTLDLIAGVTRRAPRWIQRIGGEWLFRLLQEPRRLWKRYVRDLLYFAYFFGGQVWLMRTRQPHLPPAPPHPPADALVVTEQTAILRIQGRMDVSNCTPFVQQAAQALRHNPFLVVDLAQAEFLDSSALGALVNLTNQARKAGGELWLANVPPAIARVLELLKLDQFFEIQTDIATVLRLQQAHMRPADRPEEQNGWGVVKLPRVVDTTAVRTLTSTCQQRMATHPRLIFDLAETMLLSSAGLSLLLMLNQQANAQGGAVRVAGCTPIVWQSLEQVGLDTLFFPFPDVLTAATT